MFSFSDVHTAESNETDPLCKMISGDTKDPNNQHYRFCVAVSRSSHFKNELKYPYGTESYPCVEHEILFKTDAGKAEAGNVRYFEQMTLCHSRPLVGPVTDIYMYISRAYESNKLFVYLLAPTQHASNGNVYLQNLFTNVSIVDLDEN